MTTVEYVNFNKVIAVEEKIDPVTLDELELTKEHPHPRGMITVRRDNGKPFPYNVDSFLHMYEVFGKDAVTRRPISDLDVIRAKLYKECVEAFPDYNMDERDSATIFNRWKNTYSDNCALNEETKNKYRLEARGFLQVEDITEMFKEYAGKASLDNRGQAFEELKDKWIGTWLLRNSSLKGDDYNHAYVLSCKTRDSDYPSGVKHFCIVHRIGGGFFAGVRLERNVSCATNFSYEVGLPCLVDVLEYYQRKGHIKLHQTYGSI